MVPDPFGLFVGDISGHGVAGALLTALLKSMIQAEFRGGGAASEAFLRLNDRIAADFPEGMFVSGLFLGLSPDRPGITFLSGCPDPGLILAPDGSWRTLPQGAPLLGMFSSEDLPGGGFHACELTLEAGETLIVVTDGLLEAHSPDGRPLTLQGLGAFLKEAGTASPQAIADGLLSSVRAWCGPRGPEDDLMCLALRRAPAAFPARPG